MMLEKGSTASAAEGHENREGSALLTAIPAVSMTTIITTDVCCHKRSAMESISKQKPPRHVAAHNSPKSSI